MYLTEHTQNTEGAFTPIAATCSTECRKRKKSKRSRLRNGCGLA